MRRPAPTPSRIALAIGAFVLVLAGCGGERFPTRVARDWVAGASVPAFDPDGPPDALRTALERLLSRGLVETDSSGGARLAAADRVEVTPDSLRWTFHLRAGLRFTDGTPVTSGDFRDALRGGLARRDHATRGWLLACIDGCDRVRAGRPLPPLGIDAPDPATLILRLSRRDPRLLEHLAAPGVTTPWRSRARGAWSRACGLGPYRVLREDPARALVLVRGGTAGVAALADTLRIRFVPSGPRVRTLLRAGLPDLVWPVPPGALSAAIPADYHLERRGATPVRQLLLVLRCDVPPTTQLPARAALWDALDANGLREALGPLGAPVAEWLPGAGRPSTPGRGRAPSRAALERGARSFHVTLSFDRDGPEADVARALQGQWSEQGLYAELRGLRGDERLAEALAGSAGQAQLVVHQSLTTELASGIAAAVVPLRGPAVGSFRTGWRTREFDAWGQAGAAVTVGMAAEFQRRIEEERVLLPVAQLPWVWIERGRGYGPGFHPRYGPEFAGGWHQADGPEVRH